MSDQTELPYTLPPTEFISAMSTNAQKALSDYLKANGAPEQVFCLIDGIVILERAQSEHPSKWDVQSVIDGIPAYAQAIVDLGGKFMDAEGCSTIARQPVPWGEVEQEVW